MNNAMVKSECENIPEQYFYFINCSDMEKDLCDMEMKSIFGKVPKDKILFSNKDFDPSRSPFIKFKINDFKVNYMKSEDGDVSYEERLKAIRGIGFVVTGFPDMHNPKVELAVTKFKDKWIFGELIKNDFKWQKHNDKPYSYSNAIPLRMARALVNIATCDDRSLNIIDPCCGVGTVVIEALDLGFDVRGYEISKSIACNARNNIEYLGYNREIITSGDMHDIKEKYDVAIVDIPYGLYSPITVQEQVDIINTSRRIARRLVIITFEDMDNIIISAGFRILDKCYMTKGNMKREISICE